MSDATEKLENKSTTHSSPTPSVHSKLMASAVFEAPSIRWCFPLPQDRKGKLRFQQLSPSWEDQALTVHMAACQSSRATPWNWGCSVHGEGSPTTQAALSSCKQKAPWFFKIIQACLWIETFLPQTLSHHLQQEEPASGKLKFIDSKFVFCCFSF